MKLSTNRVVGIIAVVLAIVAAVVLGQMRKDHFLSKSPTELLEVEYRQWICDEAKLLDDATVKTVEQYNAAWDEKYYAVVAVASVERMVLHQDMCCLFCVLWLRLFPMLPSRLLGYLRSSSSARLYSRHGQIS